MSICNRSLERTKRRYSDSAQLLSSLSSILKNTALKPQLTPILTHIIKHYKLKELIRIQQDAI